jgi:hypothetical protein
MVALSMVATVEMGRIPTSAQRTSVQRFAGVPPREAWLAAAARWAVAADALALIRTFLRPVIGSIALLGGHLVMGLAQRIGGKLSGSKGHDFPSAIALVTTQGREHRDQVVIVIFSERLTYRVDLFNDGVSLHALILYQFLGRANEWRLKAGRPAHRLDPSPNRGVCDMRAVPCQQVVHAVDHSNESRVISWCAA